MLNKFYIDFTKQIYFFISLHNTKPFLRSDLALYVTVSFLFFLRRNEADDEFFTYKVYC